MRAGVARRVEHLELHGAADPDDVAAAQTTIDLFNEPICPPCGSFIRSNAADIDTAVNNKKLAVRYHLLNFLDDKSHSQDYSTRAVAATYCVAAQNDPKLYAAFYAGLFASNFQPQEGAAEDRTDPIQLTFLPSRIGRLFGVDLWPVYGPDPASRAFGARHFPVGGAYGHSGYFTAHSQALASLADIVDGRLPR